MKIMNDTRGSSGTNNGLSVMDTRDEQDPYKGENVNYLTVVANKLYPMTWVDGGRTKITLF